jgi:hypothetical protein
MILPEADLAIPRRQFASLDAALKYFHHSLLVLLCYKWRAQQKGQHES